MILTTFAATVDATSSLTSTTAAPAATIAIRRNYPNRRRWQEVLEIVSCFGRAEAVETVIVENRTGALISSCAVDLLVRFIYFPSPRDCLLPLLHFNHGMSGLDEAMPRAAKVSTLIE